MSIMVVGGDHLGSIGKNLNKMGYEEINHIKGRKDSDVKLKIPRDTSMVLVLTDYINHNLAKKVKEKAKQNDTPIIYAKRSWSDIYSSIQDSQIS